MSNNTITITQASYDGEALKVWWTPSSDSNVTGYRILVGSSDLGVPLESDAIANRASDFGSLPLSTPLNSNIVYAVQVQTQMGGGPGLASPQVPLLTSIPVLNDVYYDGSTVYFAWTPVPDAAAGYQLKVFSQDSGALYTVDIDNPFASSGMIPASTIGNDGLDVNQQWVASVCALGVNKVSACSTTVEFPKPLPTVKLNSAAYQSNNALLALWQQTSGATGYQLEVTSPQDNSRYTVDIPNGMSSSGVLSFPRALYPNQHYAFRLIARMPGGAGVATPVQGVTASAPQVLGAVYDGTDVTLRWSASADNSVTKYTLKVMSLSSGMTYTQIVSGQSATIGKVAAASLDGSQDWVATVSAMAPGQVDAESVRFPLSVLQPVPSALSYDGRQITVSWMPVADPSVVAYEIELLVNGTVQQVVAIENPLAARAVLLLDSPLTTTDSAAVRIDARADNGAVAQGSATSLPVTLPAMNYVSYDGTQLKAGWGGVKDAVSYCLRVAASDTGVQYTQQVAAPGTSATLSLPGMLGTSCEYLVTLCAKYDGGIEICSSPYPLLTVMPVLQSLIYDGATVSGRWAAVADSAATLTGYELKIVSQSSGVSYSKIVNDPFATQAVIDTLPESGLDPTQVYAGTIVALGENKISAAMPPVTLVSSVPSLSNASYGCNGITAGWSQVGGENAAVTGYRLAVTSDQDDTDYSVFVPNRVSTSGVLGLPRVLYPGQAYRLTVAAVTAGGVEGCGPGAAIITERPHIQQIGYDGQSIHFVWQPITDSAVTSYTLKVISLSSGTIYSNTIADPQAGEGAVQAPAGGLDTTQEWAAEVWADGPVASVSDPMVLLVTRPVITALSYNAEIVAVDWTPVADRAVTAYHVCLQTSAGEAASVTVEAIQKPSAEIPLSAPLDTTKDYTVIVTALAGEMSAASDAMAVDNKLPEITSLISDNGTVNAIWNAVENPSVTGYLMQVSSPISGRSFSLLIDGRTTTSGSLPVDGLLGTDSGYVFSLCTQSGQGISACSALMPLITQLPTLTQIGYDGNVVNAQWAASADASANLKQFQLTVRLASDTTPVNTATIDDPRARQGSVTVGELSGDHVAEIRAVAQSGAVTVSAPIAIINGKSELGSVSYGNGLLTATWTAAQGEQYLLTLQDAAGSRIAERTVSGGRTFLDVVLDSLDAYHVQLQKVVESSTGPAGDPLTVIAAVPVISGVNYDGAKVVVTWTPPTNTVGISGYQAQLLEDGQPKSLTPDYDGNQASFSTTLEKYRRYQVVVQAVGDHSTGPLCDPVVALPEVPHIQHAELDGSTLNVSWSPIRDPLVTGYRVVLFQGTEQKQAFISADTSLSEVLTLSAGERYTVRIQALSGLSSGEMSAAFPVASYGYQYYVNGAQTTVQPYLYRTLKSTPPAEPAESIAVYLPEIFATSQTQDIPATPDGIFSLKPTGSEPYPYVINFPADSDAWKFDHNAIRVPMATDYDDFLIALESVSGGMTEFGLALVREVLALAMPLTFEETLFYRYGFHPANGYCDLQSGMGLRLDSEAYQFVGNSPTSSQVSGFVVMGSRNYDIGSYLSSDGDRDTGFNAFLSALQRPYVPPNSRGSGGVIDLYSAGFRRKYYRLFYPSSFSSADSQGTMGLDNNAAILGCDSWEALTAATSAYLSTGNFDSVTEDISYTFFRGRMVSTPLIQVLLNGEPYQLPIGSTVRELVQRFVQLPMAQNTQVSSLRLERLTGNVVSAPQTELLLNMGQTSPVKLAANPYQSVLQHKDSFDLPLLNGDRLTIA